jgi:DNA-binding NarL/FixJ family response regulator
MARPNDIKRRETKKSSEAVGGEVRVALIDSRALVRDAMSHFLQTSGNFVVLPFPHQSEFFDQCPDPARHVDVVALNIGAVSLSDERVQADLCQLRDRLSELPLVLIGDDVEPSLALEVLRHGVKGYIPTTLSPSVTIEVLRLVCAGGTFVPPDLLPDIEEQQHRVALDDSEGIVAADLTARQHEVFELIRKGKPNKIIAAELHISASTVKVYVHQIMKKLGAINRTHACYLFQPARDDETRDAASDDPLPPPHVGAYRQ